jgi:hypothetical protein
VYGILVYHMSHSLSADEKNDSKFVTMGRKHTCLTKYH